MATTIVDDGTAGSGRRMAFGTAEIRPEGSVIDVPGMGTGEGIGGGIPMAAGAPESAGPGLSDVGGRILTVAVAIDVAAVADGAGTGLARQPVKPGAGIASLCQAHTYPAGSGAGSMAEGWSAGVIGMAYDAAIGCPAEIRIVLCMGGRRSWDRMT